MTPVQLVTFAKSRIEKLGRASGNSVVGVSEGDDAHDYDSEIFQGHGIVSRPSTKTRGVRIRVGNLGIVIAAYTYGVEPPANAGATKVYSTDESGAEQASVLLDSDGTLKMNKGTDWAVRYSALETAFNELKSKFNYHTHTGVTTGGGVSGTTATPSAADITTAKVEEILIP